MREDLQLFPWSSDGNQGLIFAEPMFDACVLNAQSCLVNIFVEIPHRLPANTLSPRNTHSDGIGTVTAPVVGR